MPTSPMIVVAPSFVMPVPARTAKLAAVPKLSGSAAAPRRTGISIATLTMIASGAVHTTVRRLRNILIARANGLRGCLA